jgi:hypothetical protein
MSTPKQVRNPIKGSLHEQRELSKGLARAEKRGFCNRVALSSISGLPDEEKSGRFKTRLRGHFEKTDPD